MLEGWNDATPTARDRHRQRNRRVRLRPDASRLSHIDAPSANEPKRNAGTRFHEQKATAERTTGGAIAFGNIVIAAAILALALRGMPAERD
jgi:hypothetical protein